MQVYAVTIVTESIFGALAPGHGTKMHRQQNTDNSTETLAQTSLCHTICICYISVIPTVFYPFTPCFQPFLHSQSVWRSVMSCAPHSLTEKWWAHTATCHFLKTLMQYNQKPFPLVLLEDISLTPCFLFMLHQSLVQPFSRLTLKILLSCQSVSFLFLLPHLCQNFPFSSWLIEIAWACCPWGSRFGRLPLATNSCHSGRKPGLDLQREIIECVFIHDQSLVQKVLGHLDRKK